MNTDAVKATFVLHGRNPELAGECEVEEYGYDAASKTIWVRYTRTPPLLHNYTGFWIRLIHLPTGISHVAPSTNVLGCIRSLVKKVRTLEILREKDE